MNAHIDLTAFERAASLVEYDQETGLFTRKGTASSRWKEGQRAGTFDAHGYVVLNVGGTRIKAHRLAWFIMHGEAPDLIDHINGDKADNRAANLRPASKSLNCLNTWRARANNQRTGLQGVTKISGLSKMWAARIGVNGKRIHIGSFATPELAHAAYLAAKRDLLGETANA